MTTVDWFNAFYSPGAPGQSPGVETEFVFKYTFEAQMADGAPAFLYLDNVVFNTWPEGYV